MKARIEKSAKRIFQCRLEDQSVIQATARGKIFKTTRPVVGDFVEIIQNDQNEYEILELHPRKNEIYRQLIREKKKKVLASNIDLMVIVMSVSRPEFKRGLVDRYLLRARQWNIPTIIVFNKMDEFDNQFSFDFELGRLESLNIKSFEISALNANYNPQYLDHSFNELKAVLENKTAIFMGQSGVGKSKLISTLSEGEVNLESRELAKVGKGAHTTTWAEIINLKNFTLVDSPGIRTLSIEDITPEQLVEFFPDLEELMHECQFKDCKHQENSKGCVFKELEADNIKHQYIQSRLESFLRFREELHVIPEWEKK